MTSKRLSKKEIFVETFGKWSRRNHSTDFNIVLYLRNITLYSLCQLKRIHEKYITTHYYVSLYCENIKQTPEIVASEQILAIPLCRNASKIVANKTYTKSGEKIYITWLNISEFIIHWNVLPSGDAKYLRCEGKNNPTAMNNGLWCLVKTASLVLCLLLLLLLLSLLL